uniref:LAGLIDADG homing endonuclease n=1 Tax=Myochromella boudieri TaxID=117066 RepID=A0A386TY36_9AGAR|nr:LAGLIDADG homing endonuclease [Myochromella boudieri]AYE93134.1 LAGLIDADG homing endonuclease [Myochromella boudieri]
MSYTSQKIVKRILKVRNINTFLLLLTGPVMVVTVIRNKLGYNINTVKFTGANISTMLVLLKKYFFYVKTFVSSYNPQITKARITFLYKSNITLNSGLSMWVGISEAIRVLFFNFFFNNYGTTIACLNKLKFLICCYALNTPLYLKKGASFTYYAVATYLNSYTDISPPRDCKRYMLKTKTEWEIEAVAAFTAALAEIESPLKAEAERQKSLKPLINKSLISDSKTHKVTSLLPTLNKGDKRFNQWLAGLIDGDGCFQLSKKGYASLEIVMQTRDKNCLFQIKQKYGGSIKLRSTVNYLRYRMHHKQGMLDLINAVNGEIRNPIRLLQLNKICEKYNIPLIQPSPLTFENGWLSGFMDSDGSVYLNLSSSQMYITALQKNKYLLDLLQELYGGSVYIEKISFKWVVYKKSEIIKLLDYFKLCPCRSAKNFRIKGIKKYLELRELKAHLATDTTILGKAWKKFLLQWDKWEKIDK